MALIGLHHIHLRARDLEGSRAFAHDFGLIEAGEQDGRIFLRGTGEGAYHVVLEGAESSSLAGFAFEVDGDPDLEAAVRDHGASDIRAMEGPGGGKAVTMRDPEGNYVHLVAGIARRQPDPVREGRVYNHGPDKPRRGSSQVQAPLGPPQLYRLGHIGLFVRDAAACDRWYREVLGLLPSDIMYAGSPDNMVAGFYRVNRGSEWVEHHTLALFGMGKSEMHHASFEVHDSEVQFMGHRWMAQRNHESIWGVGRHPKGSHVFDVWRDPSGFRFETFSDTDLCTADQPADVFPIQEATMDLWSDRSHEAYFA